MLQITGQTVFILSRIIGVTNTKQADINETNINVVNKTYNNKFPVRIACNFLNNLNNCTYPKTSLR